MKPFLLIVLLSLVTQHLVLSQTEQEMIINGATPPPSIAKQELFTVLNPDAPDSDPILQDRLNFGTAFMIDQGTKSGRLPLNGGYVLDEVYQLLTQQGNTTLNYFDVVLSSDQGLPDVRVGFNVYDDPVTSARSVSWYAWRQTLFESEDNLESFNQEWPIAATKAQYDSDPNLQSIVTFGFDFVISQGIAANAIQNQVYTIDELYFIAQMIDDDTNSYFIDVGLYFDQTTFGEIYYIVEDEEGTRNVVEWYAFKYIEEGPPGSEHKPQPQPSPSL